ncbi:phage tail protein [Malaciobacter halophilus]|nr:tail protein X [Malaciobacter halophilus]RYA23884.1 phage tail protein [Malaciobacter halophilus]
MTTYIAQEGDRLDQIVFRHYKTLIVFEKVVEANPSLKNRTILKDDEVINLPVITIEKTKTKEVKSLW